MLLNLIIPILFVTCLRRTEGAYDESNEFVFQEYLRWNYTFTNPNCSTPDGYMPCQDIRACNYAAVSFIIGGWPTLCGWVGKGVPKVCCDLPLILGPDLIKVVDAEKTRKRACGTNFLPNNLSPTETKFMEIFKSLPPIDTSTPEKFDPPLDLNFRHLTRGSLEQSKTRQGEFPWMVSVREKELHVCGGSLVSRKHVLTAARCVKKSVEQYSVHIGNLFADEGYPIVVTKISTQPWFANIRLSNDLALLTLKEEIITPRIPHICLLDDGIKKNVLGKKTTLLRWGTNTTQGCLLKTLKVFLWNSSSIYDYETQDGQNRQWLFVTEGLKIVSSEKCERQVIHRSHATPKEMIGAYVCAELRESFPNTCEAGTGGLLMFQDNLDKSNYNSSAPWFLIAMDTLEHVKKFNGEYSQYVLFARVSSCMDWIVKRVAKVGE